MISPGQGARDDVLETQAAFRALLNGLARPGTVTHLPAPPHAPTGVDPRLLQVALVLLDAEVTFATAGDGALARYVGLLTGSRVTVPEGAAFLLASGSAPVAEIEALPAGTAECPEDGATVVLAVRRCSPARPAVRAAAADSEAPVEVVLTGPGIEFEAKVWITGLDPANLAVLARRNAEFPLGIDAFVVSESGEVIGLPRTVCFARRTAR